VKGLQHGTAIEVGPQDWQVYQQENGFSQVHLSGSWHVLDAAAKMGIKSAAPVVRVSREDDGFPVIAWTEAKSFPEKDGLSGSWQADLNVPAGGLYKIETGLDVVSAGGEYRWRFRGDLRFHIGVGNIFLIAGQSNAAGYAADSAYDPPDMRVHLFRNRLRWELACHPMNETTGAESCTNADVRVNGASPYLSFARRFADYSGYPVGLIQSAMSGQPIARWDPKRSGSLLYNMLERAKQNSGEIAGVLWYQGCTDASESGDYAAYGEIFADMVEKTRQQLGYCVPFFTFQLNRLRGSSQDQYWGMVREAQRRAALSIPGVHILPTIDSGTSDEIHNNAHGCVALGERLSRQVAAALLGMPSFNAPDIVSADFKDGLLSLEFANVGEGLIMQSASADDWGFTVEDKDGDIQLLSGEAEGKALRLRLARRPGQGAYVSFAWQADPTSAPPLDSRTYMPPLSFYRFIIRA
jgi:sialate O-acetylesterase